MNHSEFTAAGGRFEENKLFVKGEHAASITVIDNRLTLRVHDDSTEELRDCIDFVVRSFMIHETNNSNKNDLLQPLDSMKPKLTRLEEWEICLRVLKRWSDVPGLTAAELMKGLEDLIKENSDGTTT